MMLKLFKSLWLGTCLFFSQLSISAIEIVLDSDLADEVNEVSRNVDFEFQEHPEELDIDTSLGSINGQVFDKESGESLRGVVILIEGTDYATISHSDGAYDIAAIEAGIYDLTYFKDGYLEAKVTDTRVVNGEVTTLNFALPRRPVEMSDDVYELQDFVVTAQEVMSQNVALISLRKQSIGAIEALSSEDFKKYASSNMADAMTRISGASISDGKYAVIRGLDDRYNSVLLNNILLPSPDPDRKAIALNIFPTKLFSNLIVKKSFTADLPGDSSGGALSIETKGVPEKTFFNFSYGLNLATVDKALDKNTYLADPERFSYTDWIAGEDKRGFSVAENSKELIDVYGNYVGSISYPQFEPSFRKFPFEALGGQSFAYSAGTIKDVSSVLTVGGILAQNFSYKYKSSYTEVEKISIEDGYFTKKEIGNRLNWGGQIKGTEAYQYSTLLSLGAEISDHSKLGYTFVNIQDFESEAILYDYVSYDDQAEQTLSGEELEIGVQNNRDLSIAPIQKDFNLSMFNGSHSNDIFDLSWNYADIHTEQNENDVRSVVDYYTDYGSFIRVAQLPKVARFDRETIQKSTVYNIDLKRSFDLSDNLIYNLDFGYSESESERDFEQLEARIATLKHATNAVNFVAMPAPDGFAGNASQYFFVAPEDSKPFAEEKFDQLIDPVINDKNRKLETISDTEDLIAGQQTQLDSIDATIQFYKTDLWETLSGDQGSYIEYVDGVPKIFDPELGQLVDPDDPLDPNFINTILLIAVEEGKRSPLEVQIADSQSDLENLRDEVDDLDASIAPIEAERAAMIEFYDTVAALDSYVDLPDYSFNYSSEGSTVAQHLLPTDRGFGFFTASDASTNRNYFTSVDYAYSAKGLSQTKSFYLNNTFKLTRESDQNIVNFSFGLRREDSQLSYELFGEEIPNGPKPISAIIQGFEPYVLDYNFIDESNNYYYYTTSFEPSDAQFKLFYSHSRTSAKPTFREIAPFPIFNLTDKSVDVGNPGLIITDIRRAGEPDEADYYLLSQEFAGLTFSEILSHDLRIDYYLDDDGLISFGVFRKEIKRPIERVLSRTMANVDINTYLNNDNDASVEGIEFEFKKSYDDFSFGGNYSYIDAVVERSTYEKEGISKNLPTLIDSEVFTSGSESERSLYNQPNYMGNFFLSYYLEKLKLTLSLSKNWTGKQLYRAGYVSSAGGSPDLYWDGYDSTNLVVEYELNENWTLKFTAKNLAASARKLIYGEAFSSQLIDSQVYEESDRDNLPYFPLGDITSFNRKKIAPLPSYSVSISGKF